jgi:hypothetical protein
MEKSKTKRTFESQPAIARKARLTSTRVPALDKVTPEVYSHLSPKQQVELVGRLIEFLKTI